MTYPNDLIRQHAEFKKMRADRYRNESKDRLAKILKKKVTTTMIGALASIESHFGFLWENNGQDITPEQRVMYDIYQTARQEILDKGNVQVKNIDAELAQYDIKWLRYTTSIPIKMKKEDNDAE